MAASLTAILPQLRNAANFLDQYNLMSPREARRMVDPRFERGFADHS